MMKYSLILLTAVSFVTTVAEYNLNIGLLTFESEENENMFSLQLAVEDINKNSTLLPNVLIQLNVSHLPVECDRQQFIEKFRQMSNSSVVTTFAPEKFCDIYPLLASNNGRGIAISHVCSDETLSDKLQYPRFIRTLPSDSQVAHAINAFLSDAKWNRITLVVQNQRKWTSISRLVLRMSREYQLDIDYISWFDDTSTCCRLKKVCCHEHWANAIILNTFYKTKVYLFLGEVIFMREFLQSLSEIAVADLRRIAVVTFDNGALAPNNNYIPKWRSGIPEHLKFLELMEPESENAVEYPPKEIGLFVISRDTIVHEAFVSFSNRLRILKDTKDEASNTDESASVRAAYIYDALVIYARALDRILRDQHITSEDHIARVAANGTALVEAILSLQNFTSVTGEMISFDRNGDRLVSYVIAGSRPWLKTWNQVESAGKSMILVGLFESNGKLTSSAEISWSPEEPAIPVLHEPLDSTLFAYAVYSLCIAVTASIAPAAVSRLNEYLDQKMQTTSSAEEEIGSCLPPYMVAVNDTSKVHNHSDWRMKVYTRTLHLSSQRDCKSRAVRQLTRLREMRHPNVNRLMGAFVGMHRIVLASEYCANRSLWDLLVEKNQRLSDRNVVASLVLDLIRGMIYLHQQKNIPSVRSVHGNLKSTNCLVDSHWNLKLSDIGMQQWPTHSNNDSDSECFRRLWWAPELLREEEQGQLGTQKGDIYAFGIILHEILGKEGPFGIWRQWAQLRDPKDVIEIVKRGPTDRLPRYRPPLECIMERWNGRMDPHLCWCMKECWREDPRRRPKSFEHILEGLQDLQMTQGVDFVVQIATASDRSSGINALVEKERQMMRQRKQKLDELLSFIMPLQRSPLVPRPLRQASVLVVDIVRFTDIASMLTPIQTMYLLDDVYSLFDEICRNYGGNFKIGTHGDAYIAAGVDSPVYQSVFECNSSDEWNPAVQIANMAKEFLARVSNTKIPELGQPLNVRIGIHQGPACLGFVEWYWIFGRSVSVAFKMQSTGCRSAIQLSRAFYDELVRSGQFRDELDPAPSAEVNRTGQESYWLRPAASRLDPDSCRDPHPSKLCYRGSVIISSP